jgi:hypothetical protein
MTFKPGQSGNPAGRAVGSRNKKTLAVEAALFEHAQELVDDLVKRAKQGEPAAMRLAMERILPTGRGRPLPIELPPVNSAADAQAAAGVIMDALKEGALSAREAVDLINVVAALTRLTGALEYIKKVARTEVAKPAQTLGFEHFLAGRPHPNFYAERVAEMNADEEAGEVALEDLPDRHPDENRSTQDPLYRWNREPFPGTALAEMSPASNHPEEDGLQIVADSEVTADVGTIEAPPTPDPSPPLASLAGGGEPRGL